MNQPLQGLPDLRLGLGRATLVERRIISGLGGNDQDVRALELERLDLGELPPQPRANLLDQIGPELLDRVEIERGQLLRR